MSIPVAEDKPGLPSRAGLSAVEILILVALVAALSSVAVPRASRAPAAEPAAAAVALGRNLRAATATAHALWLASGQPATVTLEGRGVGIAYGYPTRQAIEAALGETGDFRFDPASGEFSYLGQNGRELDDCLVRYLAPAARGQAATVTVVTFGC